MFNHMLGVGEDVARGDEEPVWAPADSCILVEWHLEPFGASLGRTLANELKILAVVEPFGKLGDTVVHRPEEGLVLCLTYFPRRHATNQPWATTVPGFVAR